MTRRYFLMGLLTLGLCLILACSSENQSENKDLSKKLLCGNSPVFSYLNASSEKIVQDLGDPLEISSLGKISQYMYDNISFTVDTSTDKIISINLNDLDTCKIDGKTLNKNREELIATLGDPTNEGWNYSEENEESDEYFMMYNDIYFGMPSPEEKVVYISRYVPPPPMTEEENFQERINNAIQVSATKLEMDYKSNEISANQKYKGKDVVVTGMIESVEQTFGMPQLILMPAEEFSLDRVTITLEKSELSKAANLSPRQRVRVLGVCDGTLMGMIGVSSGIMIQ